MPNFEAKEDTEDTDKLTAELLDQRIRDLLFFAYFFASTFFVCSMYMFMV